MIGVVGEDATAIADRIGADGAAAVDPGADEDHEWYVAVGETAVLDLVRADATGPILPVDAGVALEDVAMDDLETAIDAIRSGAATVEDRWTLAVEVDGDRYRALMDVTAVTTEPAKISEFGIETGAGGDRRSVDRVRADGVVVATPAGTPGYATTAGGPIVAPDLPAVAVVPIGPFRVERTHWVLGLPTTISVARDEVPVSLLIDERGVREVPAHEPIVLTAGPTVSFYATDVSRSPFDGR